MKQKCKFCPYFSSVYPPSLYQQKEIIMTAMKSTVMKSNMQTAKTKTDYRVIAGIEFGVPSKDCKNFGLCKLEIIDQIIRSNGATYKTPAALALILIKGEEINKAVDFFFLKQGMNPEKEEKHFGDGIFILEEDFKFSTKSPCVSSSEAKIITLKAAVYPVHERPWGYWVRFEQY